MPKISTASGSGTANGSGAASGSPTTGGSAILGKLIGGQRLVGKKEKVPAYVTAETLNRLRNTVVALQKFDDGDAEVPVSLSSYVEEAILAALDRDEREYNDGKPFKQRRQRNLKTGPPVQR
ncbi:hypothetical protein ACFV2Q_38950 [Streptomyces sp. NPDC059650]|uniref:hypothetical protein n=1 Tax=Streptomyces sp. NPDC059650 TaxID=3346896 RepID=UPI0036886DB8